ncbi:MAG TPA: hypothetical protein VMV87_21110 [Burkholderiales bacterium]|nr:hypothetical protein [Burkholderiales bacterium]
MADKPEERARAEIDRLLAAAGWSVQSMSEANIHAARGRNKLLLTATPLQNSLLELAGARRTLGECYQRQRRSASGSGTGDTALAPHPRPGRAGVSEPEPSPLARWMSDMDARGALTGYFALRGYSGRASRIVYVSNRGQ